MSQPIPSTSLPSPSVTMHSGRPATTSLEVAKFFGKRHDHVVRDIGNLISQLPENFLQPNFGESTYEQETPMGTKQARMFTIYRDGFMLLVMGYTGKKAMQIKIAYIEAFNLMEKELAGQKALPPAAEDITQKLIPSTPAERKPLRSLLTAWAFLAGVDIAVLRAQMRAHFRVNRLEELPAGIIPEALEWGRAQIAALPRAITRDTLGEGSNVHTIPDPKPAPRTTFIHMLTGRKAIENRWKEEGLFGLTTEEKFERITLRLEKIRTRTAEDVNALCWDLMLLLKADSQRCSPFLVSSIVQNLHDNIVLQVTAPAPMGGTRERNPVLFIQELNKALQE